jgi:hypothetical protein
MPNSSKRIVILRLTQESMHPRCQTGELELENGRSVRLQPDVRLKADAS